MSRFFIDRPVFATVLSIIIVLIGLVSMKNLPVAQFPTIAPPTVQVQASYPGATAETVAQSVAAPIEQELSGAKGMMYYQSQCGNDGNLTVTVTFEIGTDLDMNAVEVQNRVQRAQARLPQEVTRQGLTITKKSTDIVLLVNLSSSDKRYDDLFLANYATINLLDAVKRIPGVGDAMVFGAGSYAMRIWLRPDLLAQKQLTVSDVAQAISEQNGLYAAGRLGARPNPQAVELTIPVVAPGRLSDPKEFEQIILRANPDGSMLRLGDVARAELGAQSYDQFARLNGQPTTLLPVYLQPGANALDTAQRIKAEMVQLSKAFPDGVTYQIPYDTTTFVKLSIHEVVKTFYEAVVLVLLVVFIFLQSWRATLIPLLAVPISIVGTFAGMQAIGFSINSLTLFGLVLAIGIVVDDAIVVVENVERIMHDEKLPVREATVKAMKQVSGPVIAIVLVLSAVFLPVAFLGGLTGVMYRQFAVTIAVSVALSGVVALTFSPAMCRIMLKPKDHSHTGKNKGLLPWLADGFNKGFDSLTTGYTATVRQILRFSVPAILAFGLLIFAAWRLMEKVPGGFIPDEDQGYLMTAVIMPDGASLDRTQAMTQKLSDYFNRMPEVENVIVMGGLNILANANSTDAALLYVTLKDWKQRPKPSQQAAALVAKANRDLMAMAEGVAVVFNPPAVSGLGTRAGFELQIQNRSSADVRELAQTTQAFLAKLSQRPEITGLAIPLSVALPQLSVQVDRQRVKTLGVPINDVFSALQAFWGSLYINDFDKFGRIWRVQIQAEPQFRHQAEDLSNIYVRGNQGDMIPLSGLVTHRLQAGPNVVSRFNGFTCVQVTGAPKPGYSTGQAMQAIRQVADETLPQGYGYEFSGASLQEIRAGNQAPMVMAFGLIVVFLVLAAQYEKWSLPLAVLLAVPLGILGALTAIFLRGLTNDIYFQIGLLTLVGLSAKNAILIVEFCVEQRASGKGLVEAAVQAARLRLRPILMTSLAFILGVVPLAISTGAGAAGRVSIGTGVLGGMIAATFLAIFFVPLFYVLIQGAGEKLAGTKPAAGNDQANSA